MYIEICIDSLESAYAAQRGGADRLELCSHLQAGGLTPSYGLMKRIKDTIKLPVHVMVRPRAGDFLYSDEEFKVMKTDVLKIKELGFDGVVFGILLESGHADISRINEICSLARPLKTVFHRAFDVCINPVQTLEDLISCGVDSILTSGQKNRATDGIELLTELIKLAGSRIQIVIGSGITDSNISTIAQKTGATHFHLSAKMPVKSNMLFTNDLVNFEQQDTGIQYRVDENKVRLVTQMKNDSPN